jgi:acyl-CoA thioesterase
MNLATDDTEFDIDTAVDAAPDGYRATITDRWSIRGNPNGGYLLAIAARAMALTAGRADPLSITAHYLSPSTPGVASVTADVVKAGRRYGTVEATLAQEGKSRLRAIGAFGDLDELDGPTLERGAHVTPPSLPPPDECTARLSTLGPVGGATPEIMHRFDTRLDPTAGWVRGTRTGRSEIAGWTRFADGRPPDVMSLLLFADAFPPAILDVLESSWVPTVSFSVMVRARPAPGWLLAVFRTRTVVGGTIEEDGEVWDSTGRLVCLSRQLAIVLPPQTD